MMTILTHVPHRGPLMSEYGPLMVVTVPHIDFDGQHQVGMLRVHPAMAIAVMEVFSVLYRQRFPIQSMRCGPWEDVGGELVIPPREFRVQNSVGYVPKLDTAKVRVSHHAAGLAFDVNPVLNPLVREGFANVPEGAVYNPLVPGTITPEIAKIFNAYGFLWGGDWKTKKDYHHFSWTWSDDVHPYFTPEQPSPETWQPGGMS